MFLTQPDKNILSSHTVSRNRKMFDPRIFKAAELKAERYFTNNEDKYPGRMPAKIGLVDASMNSVCLEPLAALFVCICIIACPSHRSNHLTFIINDPSDRGGTGTASASVRGPVRLPVS